MPVALGIALAALAAHAGTGWRYGYFRDELYFIACSKHLAWGYVDQPPLVAFAAFLASPFHYNLLALRALPFLSAAIAVWLAARIARELGGGAFAQLLAALATFLLPAYLLLGNVLTTTSFEPLSWTLLIYLTIRLVRSGDPRYWIGISAAFAFGMYGKYSMLLFAAAVVAGLLCTPQRGVMRTWWFAGGLALAAALLAPNLVWQASHAWPFLDVVRGDFAHRHAFQTGLQLEYTDVVRNGAAFLAEQLLYTNPASVPVWLIGFAALWVRPGLRDVRFLGFAYAIVIAAAILLEAKGYYVIGVYAALLSCGAVAVESFLKRKTAQIIAAGVFLLLTLPFVPIALPLLSIDSFVSYSQALHLTGRNGARPRVVQPIYAEEFGWEELARHVAEVYHSLPPAVRARTGVFADTYGDAGALDFYGPRYGLPPAISAQNTYYLWGTRGFDGRTLIVVGASQAQIVRGVYRNVRLVATYGNPYKWVVEGPAPIYLCTDPIAPLPQLWPRFKWYGA